MPISKYDLLEHMSPEDSYRSLGMRSRHYRAIATMIFAAAELEGALHVTIRIMVDRDNDAILRKLMGQQRLKELMPLLADIIRIKHPKKIAAEDLKTLKTRTSYLFDVRNLIAHQSPAWRPEWLRYDRYHVAKDTQKRPSLLYVCRVDELENLATYTRMLVGIIMSMPVNCADLPGRPADAPANEILAHSEQYFAANALPPTAHYDG